MDAAERTLLRETILGALSDGSAADAVLSELGWFDMLAAETDDAIAIVFEALGRTNASSSALDDVVVHALGLQPRADLAVLLPPFGSTITDGFVGIATARVHRATELLIVTGEQGHVAPVADAVVEPIQGIDPAAGLSRVRVEPGGSTAVSRDCTWTDATSLGQRATAHEIAGASRMMLELACNHARERVQFGRPVAGFQAVRHRLAEALVAVEALDAALAAASAEPVPQTARLAKAVAGRTARIVAAHCQQVLAGIGFTTDHPFHRYLKRTIVLDGIFGTSDDLVVAVGRELLATRTVPMLIEL